MHLEANQLTDKGLEHRHHEDKNAEYAYDKNGNLVKKIEHKDHNGKHDEITLYTYNYENQLIKVEMQVHHHRQTVTFAYDPFGRRIEKTVSGTSFPHWGEDWREWFDKDDRDKNDRHRTRSTTYVYDNQDILMEYDHHGRVQARYIHGLGIDEHLAVEKRDDVYYYHADGLGSITALTDKKQHVVQKYKYDTFGNIVHQSGGIQQPYAFTGREFDSETGLYEYRARYYDPKTGRFNLQKDPIGIRGGINLYSAVGQNPVNYKDPLGLEGIEGAEPFYPVYPTNETIERGACFADCMKGALAEHLGVDEIVEWIDEKGAMKYSKYAAGFDIFAKDPSILASKIGKATKGLSYLSYVMFARSAATCSNKCRNKECPK